MAWNGSDQGKAKVEGQGKAKAKGQGNSSLITPRSSLKRAALAGTLVVLGGAIALYLVLGRTPAPESAAPPKAPPKKSAPAKLVLPPTNKVEKVEPKAYADMTREEKLKHWRDMYGDNLPANIKPIVYYLENPPQRTFEPNKPKFHYFKHQSERTIASLLNVRPGGLILRQPHYGDRFDDDFQSAAIDKVKILDDDPEDVKEMKRAVQEIKDEIVERVKNGEKASDIMNAEAKSLFELGMYRQDLKKEVDKLTLDPSMTDADIGDFIKAANLMLEQKGAEPLRSTSLLYRQTALAIAAERRKNTETKPSIKGE